MDVIKKIGKNIGVVVLAVLVFVIGTLIDSVCKSFLSNYYLNLIIPTLLRIAVTIVLAWLLSAKILKIDADELGLKIKKVDIKMIIFAIALPVLVLVFYAFILRGKAYVAKEGSFWKYLLTAFFKVGLAAGICEELIFRGIIFRYMKKTLGVKIAVIVPAIIFACLHIFNMQTFNITDLILLIFAGSSVSVMFTFYAMYSGSIFPGALAHTLWNTLIIGGLFGVGEIVNGTGNESFIIIPIKSASKLLTGGNFGIEAALTSIVGYILVSLLLFILFSAKSYDRA